MYFEPKSELDPALIQSQISKCASPIHFFAPLPTETFAKTMSFSILRPHLMLHIDCWQRKVTKVKAVFAAYVASHEITNRLCESTMPTNYCCKYCPPLIPSLDKNTC